jgi:hypothetical protein
MPRKNKPAPFRAAKAVKSAAREAIGSPPPTRRIPDKKKRTAEKHKATLGELLQNSEQ